MGSEWDELSDALRDYLVDKALGLAGGSDKEVYFSLGVALQYHDASWETRFSAPYEKNGRRVWAALEYEMREKLCSDGAPKPWVQEIVAGDGRELIVGVITVLVSSLSIPLSIAVPASALVLKRGIRRLCESTADHVPEKSVAQLLADMKEAHERSEQRRRKPR